MKPKIAKISLNFSGANKICMMQDADIGLRLKEGPRYIIQIDLTFDIYEAVFINFTI